MWKPRIPEKIRAHKVVALFLIILATLSSVVVVYSITALRSAPCSSNSEPFREGTMPPHTVFQLAPPGKANLCLTVRLNGQLPLGGLSLAPGLLLYTTSQSSSTASACSNSWTDCGGVTVSTSPARAFLSTQLLRIVVTIDAPAGSTRGVYWLWFWACSGGTMMWLRVGKLNQTLQNAQESESQCLRPSFEVSLTFNSYTGMTPVYQNGTLPIL